MSEPERADSGQATAERKPYAEPTVTRVPLRPEEAVLGVCKISYTAGPGHSNCAVIPQCSSQGS